jgi:UDP-N-acetylglucosamine acyltransferase
MTVKIHPTAIVHSGAELGKQVEVGAFSIVGPKVKLGDNVKVLSHAVVDGRTAIGEGTTIHPFATVGITPQDLKYKGEDTELEIGSRNTIREYVNISTGTIDGGGRTVIGSQNLFMVYTHIAHDCIIGDRCIVANSVSVAGHVEIHDGAVIGGLAGIHQFTKIGSMAMVAAGSMVAQDVMPFCMVHGDRAQMNGLNVVGLRRLGVKSEQLEQVKQMYKIVFNSSLTQDDALAKIKQEIPASEYQKRFIAFLQASNRGLCR